MKKINIIASAIVLVLSVACGRKLDFPHETFATFDAVNFSVDETVGKVTIPVSIFNPTGAEVQVTVTGVDASGVNGDDYKILSPASGVLTFSGDVTTQNVEVEIIPHVGVFTNNMVFGVQLDVTTDGVGLGDLNTAVVTIKDIDHPLAAILGEYAASGYSGAMGGAYSWKVVFDKNDESVTNVNIIGLIGSGETLVGEVNEAQDVITVPFGQVFEASGYSIVFVGWLPDDDTTTSAGNLIFTKTETGWVQSTDLDNGAEKWGCEADAFDPNTGKILGWWEYYLPGVVLTAK